MEGGHFKEYSNVNCCFLLIYCLLISWAAIIDKYFMTWNFF